MLKISNTLIICTVLLINLEMQYGSFDLVTAAKVVLQNSLIKIHDHPSKYNYTILLYFCIIGPAVTRSKLPYCVCEFMLPNCAILTY